MNRFANAGDTAVEIAENTAFRLRQAKTEIVTASKVAYQFLAGIASNTTTSVSMGTDSSGSSSKGGGPPLWLKNLVAAGAKPSSSSTLENGDDDFLHNLSPDIPR